MFDLIAFDADDTLWHNEPMFQATERRFCELLAPFQEEALVRERLLAIETRNLAHFGYGGKGFILSMIETAIELSGERVTAAGIRSILEWGHEILKAPVSLLDGVEETVRSLGSTHRLMLLTKGDLLDQESKLARSGLGESFSAVEIVSEKNAATYARIASRHSVAPERLLMVGNSLRSDVLPAIEAGAHAVHIPYEVTWAHELVPSDSLGDARFATLSSIRELPAWLETQRAG
jgi:putative hydrolase of the HAD superfamily